MTTAAYFYSCEILSVGWDVFFNFSAILGKVRVSSAPECRIPPWKICPRAALPPLRELGKSWKKMNSTSDTNLAGLNVLMHVLLCYSIWIDTHNNHPPHTPAGGRWKQRPAEVQHVCNAAEQGLCRVYGHMAMDSLGVFYLIQTCNPFILSPRFCCAMANSFFWLFHMLP